MRQIKFKAKRLDGKGWVKGSLLRSTAGIKERAYVVDSFSSMSDYSVIGVDPSTVCQFTGLTDCEGNEVWEGDLLQSQITESIYEIVWHKFLGFIMKNPRSGGHLSETLGCLLQLGKFKVIGNKFDNDK